MAIWRYGDMAICSHVQFGIAHNQSCGAAELTLLSMASTRSSSSPVNKLNILPLLAISTLVQLISHRPAAQCISRVAEVSSVLLVGVTLKENNLREIEGGRILDSQGVLVANRCVAE